LQAQGETDVLMMGDFNSYLNEDPTKTLETAGNESLLKRMPSAERYTYVFAGESGALDHGYASTSLKTQVTGVNVWHINADEPPVIDYNTEFKTNDRYAATLYRASDHDPVLVGLTLAADPFISMPAAQTLTRIGSVVVAAPLSAANDLFFSEYVEGSSSNKAVEIYNPTGASVDLTAYSVKLYSNGATTATTSLALTGTLAADATLVLVHSSATDAYKVPGSLVSGVTNFNGDDALTLEKSGAVIDRFGQLGTDPGTAWTAAWVTTVDATLRRKPTIKKGDSNASGAFDPSVEWTALPIDTATGLGSHTVNL
jgi:predicted extracellular nuclease